VALGKKTPPGALLIFYLSRLKKSVERTKHNKKHAAFTHLWPWLG